MGSTVVFNVHGETIEYYGPFGGTRVEYEIDYWLPCVFNSSKNYIYWIDYYNSEGGWIDSYSNQYPNAAADSTVFHPAKAYPCYE